MSNTPGPWKIRHGTNIHGNRRDVGHEGSVANCGSHGHNIIDCGPENEANARLIAAAPEMLAMLLELEWSSRRYESLTDEMIHGCPVCGLQKSYGHAIDCRLAAVLKSLEGT